VWAKTQVWRLSQDVKKLEGRLEELKRDNSILQRTYAAMCAPGKLDERVRELNLGLVVPLRSQIVRMPTEVVPLAQGQPQTLRYAATNHD
jgi:hypothetical protein